MKKLGVPLGLVLASLLSATVLAEEGDQGEDRECANGCGDEWVWTSSEKIRGIVADTEGSECDLKVSVECDGGISPAEAALPPKRAQTLECEVGKNIKKVTFACSSSAEGKRCKVKWSPVIEIKVPPGGGTIPYPPGAKLEPKPVWCGDGQEFSKDASKHYNDPTADQEIACKNDAANLKKEAQTKVETACQSFCQQKAPSCKWLLMNRGKGSHRCIPGNQSGSKPADEVVGIALTGAEGCNCMK